MAEKLPPETKVLTPLTIAAMEPTPSNTKDAVRSMDGSWSAKIEIIADPNITRMAK